MADAAKARRRAAALARRRHASASTSMRALERTADLTATLREHGRAIVGICVEARDKNSYPLMQATADVCSVASSLWQSMSQWCDSQHEPQALQTNQVSEAAGPVRIGTFRGRVKDLTVTPLTGAAGQVEKDHVMLRKRNGELFVSLIGIKDVADKLAAGRYEGGVFLKNLQIATIRLEHRRLENSRVIMFDFSLQ